MTAAFPPVQIAILCFPQTTASVVHGLYDLFLSAGRDWNLIVRGNFSEGPLRPLLVAATTEPFATSNGVSLVPQLTLAQCPAVDVICVPEVAIPPGMPMHGFERELAWLGERYAAGTAVATVCSGAMLLAEAGMLDGYEATTHWAYCDVLKRQFPKVKVRTQQALVVSGDAQRLVMAGGGTSWLDLGLYLIARYTSVDMAMETARMNLIDWHDIGQQPFARLARTRQVDDAVIARCQTWIAENYQEAAPVAAMVRLSGLAERSFKRRFQLATGMSPLEYVHTLRLEEAKQMLEATEESIEAIANEVGYEDAGFFSRLFKRQVNLTPAQYRKRFGAMRKALTQSA